MEENKFQEEVSNQSQSTPQAQPVSDQPLNPVQAPVIAPAEPVAQVPVQTETPAPVQAPVTAPAEPVAPQPVETQAPAPVEQTPMEVGELSDEPTSTHVKVDVNGEFPSIKVLKIENAFITKPFTGEVATLSRDGKTSFYKKKVVMQFKEIDGVKLKEYFPSVFYDGKTMRPSLPKPCFETSLTDNMTSTVAKLRCMLIRDIEEINENQSDAEFIKSLVGLNVHVSRVLGDFDGKPNATLVISKFSK